MGSLKSILLWVLVSSLSLLLFQIISLSSVGNCSKHCDLLWDAISPPTTNASSSDPMAGSLAKLRKQLITPGQEESFDRSRPIYIDFGLSDGADTGHYLSKGYSVVSVDAFLPWVTKAKEKFAAEIASNRLLLFNVGLSVEEEESMPLYYKKAGSVIASFVKEKGCQGAVNDPKRCFHADVQVVRCESIVLLINAQAELMKVDIEMLHHTCIRGLHKINSTLLPRHVCWEEHDKPFGPARIVRPLTDAKLILGLYEIGYEGIKIVMQGPKAHKYYGISREFAGHGGGSGTLMPDEMMHYRSYEDNENGKFDVEWKQVHKIFEQGIFGPGSNRPIHFFSKAGGTYYDICMKLSPNALFKRAKLQDPESFPLKTYASKQGQHQSN